MENVGFAFRDILSFFYGEHIRGSITDLKQQPFLTSQLTGEIYTRTVEPGHANECRKQELEVRMDAQQDRDVARRSGNRTKGNANAVVLMKCCRVSLIIDILLLQRPGLFVIEIFLHLA